MCGACGRTVVADPVFPDGRSTRGNLIAGQVLDALCAAAGNRVRVKGRPEGFTVALPGRRPVPCATVAEVWSAVFAAAPATAITPTAELEARYRTEIRLLRAIITASGTAPLP
ncbi:hypothetical protein [Amycolatopsis sp. DSM 110486]|uniref:hypothetical protein n=1 Tax=Amycolatopsis sp. DSM 110486 TaxID=2865832 RepID=UPI001C6A406B|nr:hypothetical protein [Amycolatopsis sp. DSM 110486]QYN17733.1 hypothetical protein K1T34_33715 [Amycolatopsis sp. DSM 110486]